MALDSIVVDSTMGVSDTPIGICIMNKGSTRKTIRFGDDLLALIDDELARRNARNTVAPITFSDYVLQAIEDKLNHARRSRKEDVKVKVEKIDDYRPREVTEE
jgi:hypothetical protein